MILIQKLKTPITNIGVFRITPFLMSIREYAGFCVFPELRKIVVEVCRPNFSLKNLLYERSDKQITRGVIKPD